MAAGRHPEPDAPSLTSETNVARAGMQPWLRKSYGSTSAGLPGPIEDEDLGGDVRIPVVAVDEGDDPAAGQPLHGLVGVGIIVCRNRWRPEHS
jgi:hypothetical protein